MSTSNKKNESKNYKYGVVIKEFRVDKHACYINTAIEKAMLEIENIIISNEKQNFDFVFPNTCIHKTGIIPILSFLDEKDLDYIKSEIVAEIKKTPWALVYFGS